MTICELHVETRLSAFEISAHHEHVTVWDVFTIWITQVKGQSGESEPPCDQQQRGNTPTVYHDFSMM